MPLLFLLVVASFFCVMTGSDFLVVVLTSIVLGLLFSVNEGEDVLILVRPMTVVVVLILTLPLVLMGKVGDSSVGLEDSDASEMSTRMEDLDVRLSYQDWTMDGMTNKNTSIVTTDNRVMEFQASS